MPSNRGPGGDFQSEDPNEPFYVPPPPPDSMEAFGEDSFVIKTYEEWLAHPDSHRFDPNMNLAETEKIRAHMTWMEEEVARNRAGYEAGWLSKKPLDDIVGSDRDLWSKRAVVAVVRRHQWLVEAARRTGQPESAVEAHTQRTMHELTLMCPDVPSDRLVTLLNAKLEELCNDPTLQLPPQP